jgi:hypothetical protein
MENQAKEHRKICLSDLQKREGRWRQVQVNGSDRWEGSLFWVTVRKTREKSDVVTVRKTREKSDVLPSSGLSERKVELREVRVLLF